MKVNQFLILYLFIAFPFMSFAQQNGKVLNSKAQLAPPYGGTIFVESDIVNPDDPSTLETITYLGRGTRTMFDRRVNTWISVRAYLFDVTFDDELEAEVQVNPEFGNRDLAEIEAEKYAWYIGQLPTALRVDVEAVWIHKGLALFGGGNNSILIHTGQSDVYTEDGILEETLIHEASHTSLDSYHAASGGWLAAQQNDPDFISTYAQDYPDREDVAESFLMYMAIRFRADRISDDTYSTVTETIPNRIAYFDEQSLDMYPFSSVGTSVENEEVENFKTIYLYQNYPNPFNPTTNISYSLPEATDVRLQIFDLLGRNVATLVNERKSAGRYTATFDASSLPSGIYIYRIEAGQSTQFKKLMLIK